MSFKDISNLQLWQPFCSTDQNHLYNFGKKNHEEQSFEIILNLDLWFRKKCSLKVFSIWSSDSQSKTICEILKEGIIRNNSGKLFHEYWLFKIFLKPSCLVAQTHLCNFEIGHHGKIHVEFYEIWTSGSNCHLKKKFTDGRTTDKDRAQLLASSLWLRWARKNSIFLPYIKMIVLSYFIPTPELVIRGETI